MRGSIHGNLVTKPGQKETTKQIVDGRIRLTGAGTHEKPTRRFDDFDDYTGFDILALACIDFHRLIPWA